MAKFKANLAKVEQRKHDIHKSIVKLRHAVNTVSEGEGYGRLDHELSFYFIDCIFLLQSNSRLHDQFARTQLGY